MPTTTDGNEQPVIMPRSTVPTSRRTDVRDLTAFLAEHRVEVLDVTSGAAPGTRRLILGRVGESQPTHAVAVAITEDAVAAVDTESRHLQELHDRLGLVMRVTIPSPLEQLQVSGLPALVVTAVPGLRARSDARLRSRARAEAGAVQCWLARLWQMTADQPEAVDLGRDVLDLLRSRSRRVSGMADTVRTVDRAYGRLSGFGVPRTVHHGCLCRQHVFVEEGVVSGVDSWGASQLRGDPLRDLGHWVVRSTGPDLDRVLAARTPLSRTLRDFVIAGLAVWAIPPAYWRDVLVLVEAELVAKGLREGDYGALEQLTKLSRAMPREGRHDGTSA
jgi:hypothetical protein